MKITAVKFAFINILFFIFIFFIQKLILTHYIPTPLVENFHHTYNVTGGYIHHIAARSSSLTIVNNKDIFCKAGATGTTSCLGIIGMLPDGTMITAEIVKLKTIDGYFDMAMNIKSGGRELFSQTPIECIKAWRIDNLHYFLLSSLMLSVFLTYATSLFITQGKSA